MEIIIGKNAGFCYGVKRAVDGASEILKENDNISCLGELVHNKEVIRDLESKGIVFIENLNQNSQNVIIRAHGIAKDIYEYMNKNRINYFDYTCPNVLNIHKIAEDYAKENYFIFLIGDSKHPENIGTISFCGKNSFIIQDDSNIAEAMSILKNTKLNKVLIIAQTTYSVKKFNDIVEKIRNDIDSNMKLIIKNTICNATETRQNETEVLSKQVECMIIIGGKNSSNTKKLYDIAKENCNYTICVESKNELNLEEIKKYTVIGIMAGASTPQSSIDEIKQELLNMEIKV